MQIHLKVMLRRNAFEARIHQAHQVQPAELFARQGLQRVFLVRRGVVEAITTEQPNLVGDFTDLLHRQFVVTLQRIEQEIYGWRMFSFQQFRIRRAFLARRAGDRVGAEIGFPFVLVTQADHVGKFIHQVVLIAGAELRRTLPPMLEQSL